MSERIPPETLVLLGLPAAGCVVRGSLFAKASRSNLATPTCPFCSANSKAERPSLSVSSIFTRLSSKSFTISALPLRAAFAKIVRPNRSRGSRKSAPLSRRNLAISVRPKPAANCNAVALPKPTSRPKALTSAPWRTSALTTSRCPSTIAKPRALRHSAESGPGVFPNNTETFCIRPR